MREKSNKKKSFSEQLESALVKKALGYDAKETVEEYVSGEEGEIKLAKKKITTKNVPPDMTALKILLEEKTLTLSEMTDEQLEEEKKRLLNLLAQTKN